jgi:hypothetical protein
MGVLFLRKGDEGKKGEGNDDLRAKRWGKKGKRRDENVNKILYRKVRKKL